MPDTEVTDEQIDERIRAWGFEGGWKGLAEELGVDVSRVNERWNVFRKRTYELLNQGLIPKDISIDRCAPTVSCRLT